MGSGDQRGQGASGVVQLIRRLLFESGLGLIPGPFKGGRRKLTLWNLSSDLQTCTCAHMCITHAHTGKILN